MKTADSAMESAAELLYGSGQEQTTDSNVADPTDLHKRESLKSFLHTDFEAGRSLPEVHLYDEYERCKKLLRELDLSPEEYQFEIKKLAERLKI